jgi:hypothetical protein
MAGSSRTVVRTGDLGHRFLVDAPGYTGAVLDAEPQLPKPRGPLSSALVHYLRGDSPTLACRPVRSRDGIGDEDLQLALYCCYELHYRGFESVWSGHEWDPDILRFRAGLERAFTSALVDAVPQPRVRDPRDAGRLIETAIADFEGPSLSGYLRDRGTRDEFAEFVVHRSAYQLKEADPHTWAIPRYSGPSRAALVEIQMDEYGNGKPGAAHADLFATTMHALDLDATYGAYLDRLPATTLATANLASMFGLHRRWLPALLGHLALFEMTSVEPMQRYAETVDRHGLGPDAREFYDVHVLADAHHGPLALHELVGRYLDEQPQDAATLVWGALVLLHVEDRLARALLEAWSAGVSSLRMVDEDQLKISSSWATSPPRIRSVASAMHRWYSSRDWRSSWTSLR